MSNDATTPISGREWLRRQPRRLTLREERAREVERVFTREERRLFAGYIVDWVNGAEYPLSQLKQNIAHSKQCAAESVVLHAQEIGGEAKPLPWTGGVMADAKENRRRVVEEILGVPSRSVVEEILGVPSAVKETK